MKSIRMILLIAVFTLLVLPVNTAHSATPTSYDLIAEVNAIRQQNGLNQVEIDNILMTIAQNQSDYLANTYGTNTSSIGNGHLDANGGSERDRALQAGFPLGNNGWIDECWSFANSETPVGTMIYSSWSDPVHWGILVYPSAKYIGVGITKIDGFIYYIVDMAGLYYSGGIPATIPTTAVTARIAPVQVATPQKDGSIIHEVKLGQAVWNIAAAYGISVEQILALNNLSDKAIIVVGQKLIVQLPYTPTPPPTATLTPRPPTRTPVPPQTVQSVATQSEGGEEEENAPLKMDRQTMGLALILISGVGLALMVISITSRGKTPPGADQ